MCADAVVSSAADGSEDCSVSNVSLSIMVGDSIAYDATGVLDQDTRVQCDLRIEPDRPAIIGRFESHEVPYLDAGLRPTTIVPGSGQTVLVSGGQGKDCRVSRAHFMLRAAAGGVLLVNGVPNREGGIRPPKNGTMLVTPESRPLEPGEEYLIENNVETLISLPNGALIKIEAR